MREFKTDGKKSLWRYPTILRRPIKDRWICRLIPWISYSVRDWAYKRPTIWPQLGPSSHNGSYQQQNSLENKYELKQKVKIEWFLVKLSLLLKSLAFLVNDLSWIILLLPPKNVFDPNCHPLGTRNRRVLNQKEFMTLMTPNRPISSSTWFRTKSSLMLFFFHFKINTSKVANISKFLR